MILQENSFATNATARTDTKLPCTNIRNMNAIKRQLFYVPMEDASSEVKLKEI